MCDGVQGVGVLFALIITLVFYAAAGWLWWQQRNPLYILALLASQLSTWLDPVWRLLYTLQTVPGLGSLIAALATPFDPIRSLPAAWPDPLPALIIVGLYLYRWWTPGLGSGLFTFVVFVSFQLLISILNLRPATPPLLLQTLPFGVRVELLAALMSATMSYGLCYVFLTVQNYSWPSMAVAILPMPTLFSVLIYGVIGAPLLIGRLLPDGEWPGRIGLILTLALLGWCVYIISSALNRLDRWR